MNYLANTFLIISIFTFVKSFGQVGINTTTPDQSAILDLEASNRGLLIPRMTTAERDAISNPAESLLIFNTDDQAFQYHSGNIGLS